MTDELSPGVEAVVAEIFEAFARANVLCYAREDVSVEDGVVLNVETDSEFVSILIDPERNPVHPKIRASWESASEVTEGQR